MVSLFRGAEHARLYRIHRPTYPPSLYATVFNYLESSGIGRETSGRFKLALDVGCGSGQSTLALCEQFETVVGVDCSESQLDEARMASEGRENVTYRQALSHELSFQADSSVDLVTVATAIHWFDRNGFFKECRRILRPGGVLAAYTVGPLRVVSPFEFKSIVEKLEHETLKDYWDPATRLVYDGFGAIFDEISTSFHQSIRDDTYSIERDCSIEDCIGLLSTWSSYQQYRQLNPALEDPLYIMAQQFRKLLVDDTSEKPIHISQPIFLLLGRN